MFVYKPKQFFVDRNRKKKHVLTTSLRTIGTQMPLKTELFIVIYTRYEIIQKLPKKKCIPKPMVKQHFYAGI